MQSEGKKRVRLCWKATILTCVLVAIPLFYTLTYYDGQTVGQEIPSPTCNFTAFQQQLRLDSWTPVVPFHLLATCQHVFYNRHPKTGSRTTMDIIGAMGKKHKYALIAGTGRKEITWALPENRKRYALERFRKSKGRFAFVVHMFFYDFRRYQDFKDTMIYLNIIREPAPWLVSWFNWAKRYADTATGLRFSRDLKKWTLEACIQNVTCSQDAKGNAIHYLCGHEDVCQGPTEAALEQATERLHRDYLSVGPMERQEEILELWEYLLPQMFSGAVQEFRKRGEKMKSNFGQEKKEIPTEESYRMLKSNLEVHYKLYDRITDRFQRMLDVVRLLKGIHPEGYRKAWANHYWTVFKRHLFGVNL